MSDIKLFKLNKGTLDELENATFTYERALQKLIEDNMETVLGIKFLQSEYATGKEHGGRIDSLGIDENYCPVIIEYKRSRNENVINQGLFYLDWLMDHKAAFQLLVTSMLGQEYADKIEWSIPRLLCIASDFTKYDVYAVNQMNRNIELIRYKKYDDDLLLLEQVASRYVPAHDEAAKKNQKTPQKTQSTSPKTTQKTQGKIINQIDGDLKSLYLVVVDFINSLGDDIQEKQLQQYKAFMRIKTIVRIKVRPKTKYLLLYLNLDPKKFHLEGLTRDVSDYHNGICNVEVKISSIDDLEQTKHLIIKSYEAS